MSSVTRALISTVTRAVIQFSMDLWRSQNRRRGEALLKRPYLHYNCYALLQFAKTQ